MSKQINEIIELLLDHELPSVQENICKTNLYLGEKKNIWTIKPELHAQFWPHTHV